MVFNTPVVCVTVVVFSSWIILATNGFVIPTNETVDYSHVKTLTNKGFVEFEFIIPFKNNNDDLKHLTRGKLSNTALDIILKLTIIR